MISEQFDCRSVFYLPKPRPLNYLVQDLYQGPTLVLQGAKVKSPPPPPLLSLLARSSSNSSVSLKCLATAFALSYLFVRSKSQGLCID